MRPSRRIAHYSSFIFRYLFFLIFLLMGCTTPPLPTSAWGEIHTLAQSEQSSAPALYISPQGVVTAAWIGADKTGIHHDMRQGLTQLVVLPLPPFHPHSQSLYPTGVDGAAHLLWLDADYQQRQDPIEGNTPYLFSALVGSSLIVERGPTRISTRYTLHYAAVPYGDGGLWVAWSGGLPAEPELYIQRIDNTGRPLTPQRVAINADFPALARVDNETLFLFWMQPTNGNIYRALLVEGVAEDITVVSSAPTLNTGDRIANVSAGVDRTHSYLLWNIMRADGHPEIWSAAIPIELQQSVTPTRLGITLTEDAFVTGFNGGSGVMASDGEETWLAWAAPLVGQYDVLPVAVWDGAQVGVVYLQGGSVVGYQAVAVVESTLIGVPALAADRDLHLYLSWAQPALSGAADLRITSTRR